MTLGQRIRKAREYLAAVLGRKISQQELATRCGWKNGQGRVGNYETDKRKPNADDVLTIARATGVRVEWLQYEKGFMHDDHAAIAYSIKEPGSGATSRSSPEVVTVSEPLRQLMLKLMGMERAGVLTAGGVQNLLKFLDSLPKTGKG